MSAGLKMSMKLSQQLRMTPQLQQAIKMLQLSRLDLENVIRKELEENPVLEEVLDLADDDPALKDLQTSSDIQNTEEKKVEDSDPTKQDEFDWESYAEETNKKTGSSLASSGEVVNFENMVSPTKTLYDHLCWQVSMGGFNEEESAILFILIGYVDDDGWIKISLEEIAKEEEMDLKDLEEMLCFLQEFDPPGIGSRNLKECLLLQSKHLQEDTKDLDSIINDHLKDLEKKNFQAIAKSMNLNIDYVIDLCQLILSMDPKPGLIFNQPAVQYITPDVYIHKVADDYVVHLNEEGLPRLRISNLYSKLLLGKSKGGDKSTKEYVQEKLRSAVWMIKSIHQRQKTIYRVTESIVKHQKEFFTKGPEFIQPLILRDVADDLGVHESTVSRVTANKYVYTPIGLFELKYFFSAGLRKTDGESVASESIKLKIQKMVKEEDQKRPLSDQRIVEILKKEGISLARRTVAKYRDALKILPSSKRKKYY